MAVQKLSLRRKEFPALQSYLSRRPKARFAIMVSSLLAIATAFICYAVRPALQPDVSAIAFLLSMSLGSAGLLAFGVALQAYQVANRSELEQLHKQSEKLQEKISGQQTADIFTVIQLSLSQVTEYYTINKGQARKSFNFSVFAIFVGLATIIGGIWLMYSGSSSTKTSVGTISSISGLLLQFLGGANFYIYNKSLVQMNYFYDRLMRMQDTMLSIKVGEQIQNAETRDRVREQIVSGLLKNIQEKTPLIEPLRKVAKKATVEDQDRQAKAASG